MKQIINQAELDSYVEEAVKARLKEPDMRGGPGLNESAQAIAAIARMVSRYDSCMRVAGPEDIAKHDRNGALEMQAQLFGRVFHIFAPEQDKDLNRKIRWLAVKEFKSAEPAQNMQRAASGSALAAAFNGAAGTHAAPVASNRERVAQQIIFSEDIAQAARTLNIPYNEDIERHSNRFFRVLDRQKKTCGYFYTECTPLGQELLRKCRVSPGILPDPVTCEYVWAYAREASMVLPTNAGEAGVFVHEAPDRAIALQSMPRDFITDEAFRIRDIDNEFALSNLKQINAPSGDMTWIKNCTNFTSLGDLEFSRCSLHIENCANFRSLGRLKQVGIAGMYCAASLSIVNCPNLTHLGNLKHVEGDINLCGTGINAANFPASFDVITGNVYLDEGTFRYQGKGWHFPLKPVKAKPWGQRHG